VRRFHAFNLHDYKEFMHCAAPAPCTVFIQQRHLHVVGAAARAGDALYPGGYRRRNDVLFPRCSAYVYEAAMALPCTPIATTSRPRRSANTA